MAMRSRTRLLPFSPTLTPHLPRSLSTSEPEPEPESEARVSTAVTTLLYHGSKTRWNYLKASIVPLGSTFTPPESTQIILRIKRKPDLALRFFNTKLCSHDLSTFCTIIHVIARTCVDRTRVARLKPEALSLIKSAILSQSASDNPLALFQTLAKTYRLCNSVPCVFDLLIEAYLDYKKIDRAVQIARILGSKGIQPLISTSNSLIRSVSQSRGADAGFLMYKELFSGDGIRVMVNPNVSTFNTLLVAFHAEGRLEMVEEIKNEMRRFECEANVFSYSIVMAGLCDEGMVDEAEKIWGEMAAKDIKPDVLAYNTMIKGYCEAKEMEKAEKLFMEMGLKEIEPTYATLEHMVMGYCGVKDIESALALCRDMRKRGFGIESLVVDEVVEVLCGGGRVEEGLRFLRKRMRREGFMAGRRSYESVIEGYCREGEMETAIKIQAEMAGKGFGVNSKIYGDFIEGYRRLGDEEKAKRLEKEMLEMGQKESGE